MGIYQLSMDFCFIMDPAEFGITLLFLFIVVTLKLDKYLFYDFDISNLLKLKYTLKITLNFSKYLKLNATGLKFVIVINPILTIYLKKI